MKNFLRKIVHLMAKLPVVGGFVKYGVGQVRKLKIINPNKMKLTADQLDNLLQTISDINQRQLANDNLIKSVPVALRTNTRDVAELNSRVSELTKSIEFLLGRVEFVRRELMFELRYGSFNSEANTNAIEVNSSILNVDKLNAAKNEKLKLNLGCGHIPIDGYINVDRRNLPGVDIVSEIDKIPLDSEEVDEIFSSHVLEHFPQEQLRRNLLPYFYGLLKRGGVIRAVVPDSEAMIREYSSGNYEYNDLREVIYGGQDYDGDFHYNMFTPSHLKQTLEEVGFVNVEIVDRARKNGRCYEFEIKAVK